MPMAAASVAAFVFSGLWESEFTKAILTTLDALYSSGCDGISPRLLKFCCRSMTSILASLFNHSLRL